jgi:hypothetical protein
MVDNEASLNLIMRKTFIEMCLNLADLTPVHDIFHNAIRGQLSTPIGCIDREVSYGPEIKKRREMLTFKVVSFDIGYNCILGRSFLLKFMAVIHIAYATMKMPSLKGIITIKADQRDALACKNASLLHARRFGEKAAQEQATKVAKIKGGSTPNKPLVSKPPTDSTPRAPAAQKGTYVASSSNQLPADQKVDNKLKGTTAEDKEVLVDPNNTDKKLRIS